MPHEQGELPALSSGFTTGLSSGMGLGPAGNAGWGSPAASNVGGSNTQPIEDTLPMHSHSQMLGQEYEAPMPGPSHAGFAQSFSALVQSEAGHCPSEFLLEGSTMSASLLESQSKAQVTLRGLQELQESCPGALDKLKRKQALAIQIGDVNSAKMLEAEQGVMGTQLEQAIQELFGVIRTIILNSDTLLAARRLVQLLQLHQHVLEMYRQEIHHAFGSGTVVPAHQVPPVVSLYITEQPLPQVVFKEKPIEERYSISILTASQQDIVVDKHMTALLNYGDIQVKPGTSTLSHHITPIDSSMNERRANFDQLTVNISTRMSPISVKFQTLISKASFQSPVATASSMPFIVITNESQWFEAAGKLLNLDTFSSGKNVYWPQFANTLHSHYLKATRQSEAERPLYHFELNYIHQRFFESSDQVSEKQVTNFWNWFGQCLQTIRFKRYIANMWNSGIIFGFMTKDECNRVLAGQGLGTFLIRFSESLPGLFGVAYVSDDSKERIKHCLIKNEDIGSNKSLAEFLRDKDQFQLLLRMDTQELKDIGKIRRMPKDVALQNYYSKKKLPANTSNPGYIVL